jgi:hypothetical protein
MIAEWNETEASDYPLDAGHTDALTRDLEPLSETLYQEMLGHIKRTGHG